MRMISAGLMLLALVASEPAFAGCGSHGAYKSRAVSAVVKKVVQKPKAQSSVRATAAKSSEGAANTASADDSATKTAQSTPLKQCQEYSAAVGEMIAVPCS